jgi:hypothetical protein
MPGSNRDTRGDSVTVWAAISWYSVGPIIAIHDGITAREYVDRLSNEVHPTIQTFLYNGKVSQEDAAPIHMVGPVQSWFEEHESELQHLPWPAQSPDLNITETVWPILEARVRKFPTSNISMET